MSCIIKLWYVKCEKDVCIFQVINGCRTLSLSSLVSQSSSHLETHSLQNGQKPPPPPTLMKPSTSVKKHQQPPADSNKANRPAGERRCVRGRARVCVFVLAWRHMIAKFFF